MMLLALTLDSNALIIAICAAIAGPLMAAILNSFIQRGRDKVKDAKHEERFNSLKTDVKKNDERAFERHTELKQTVHNEVSEIKTTLTDHDRKIIRLEGKAEQWETCAARSNNSTG